MTRRSTIGTLISAAVALSAFAAAMTGSGEGARHSVSLGGPNEGTLQNGVRLPSKGKGFLSNPGRTNQEADYGTDELVRAIATIGSDLERWAPGAVLVVNDLSLPEGGEIPRHQSHESGRDVDMLFYTTSTKGKVLRSRAMRFDEKGHSPDGQVLFDSRRNWLFVKSLVLNDDARLQRVFVAERLRKLMLDHAASADEPIWLRERAAQAMCEPSVPHDDHFHVRIFCSAEDYGRGCRDSWPIYPWRRTEMARFGIDSVETAPPPLTRRRRRRPRRVPSFGRVWCPSPR